MTQDLPHRLSVNDETPLPHKPSAPSQRGAPSLLVICICWMIILLIVGLEVWSNIRRSQGVADAPADNATMSAIGHCVVGAHFLAMTESKKGDADPTLPLVEEMESVAKSPADRVRVAIIDEEVGSSKAADAKLDALTQSTSVPPSLKKDVSLLRMIYHTGPGALSDSQRQSLMDHEGWFGQLALTFGMPDSSPERSQVLAQAKRALLASTSAAIVGVGGLLLGGGLIVLAIVLTSTGRLPLLFRCGWPDSIFLEAFALYLSGFVLISLLLHVIVKSSGLGWTLVLTIMLPIAVLWPVMRGKPWSQTRMEIGWHSGRGFFRELACGVIGYVAALPLLAIMLVITLQLIRISGTSPSHPVVGYLSGGPGEIVLIYFIACIWAPVFEESMFRGALFNHLRARHGWWISAGIVGLLFAAVHPQGWTTIPVLGGIGMVLCALREWRGSLIASMAAHAMSNGLVITLAILTSR